MEALALPYESMRRAFTPGLAATVYGGRVTDAMLEQEAHYVHSEGDANWWIPSGQTFYSSDPTHTPPQELNYAQAHFFLPLRYRDPFYTDAVSTDTFVAYDAYDLLMLETRDPLGNCVTVGERNADPTQPLVRSGHDYRVLQPALMMDANRNRSAVAFDALGMVAGAAVMGKPEDSPVPGDQIDAAFRADLTQAEIEAFLAAPKGADGSHASGQRHNPNYLRCRRLLAGTRPAKEAPGLCRHAGPRNAQQRSRPRWRAENSSRHFVLRRLWREIPEKDSGRTGAGPAARWQRQDYRRRERTAGDDSRRGRPALDRQRLGRCSTTKAGSFVSTSRFSTDTPRFEFDIQIGVSPVLVL